MLIAYNYLQLELWVINKNTINHFECQCIYHTMTRYRSKWNLEMSGFEERVFESTWKKNLLKQEWEQMNKLNPHNLWCWHRDPSHIGGRWVLSSLCYPYSPDNVHYDRSLTKANSMYMFVGCSLRLNISPIKSPMERTKATIISSGLKKSASTENKFHVDYCNSPSRHYGKEYYSIWMTTALA